MRFRHQAVAFGVLPFGSSAAIDAFLPYRRDDEPLCCDCLYDPYHHAAVANDDDSSSSCGYSRCTCRSSAYTTCG